MPKSIWVNLHTYCSDDIDMNLKSYISYIYSVFNISVKVSGGAHHCLPDKKL